MGFCFAVFGFFGVLFLHFLNLLHFDFGFTEPKRLCFPFALEEECLPLQQVQTPVPICQGQNRTQAAAPQNFPQAQTVGRIETWNQGQKCDLTGFIKCCKTAVRFSCVTYRDRKAMCSVRIGLIRYFIDIIRGKKEGKVA